MPFSPSGIPSPSTIKASPQPLTWKNCESPSGLTPSLCIWETRAQRPPLRSLRWSARAGSQGLCLECQAVTNMYPLVPQLPCPLLQGLDLLLPSLPLPWHTHLQSPPISFLLHHLKQLFVQCLYCRVLFYFFGGAFYSFCYCSAFAISHAVFLFWTAFLKNVFSTWITHTCLLILSWEIASVRLSCASRLGRCLHAWAPWARVSTVGTEQTFKRTCWVNEWVNNEHWSHASVLHGAWANRGRDLISLHLCLTA